MQSSLIILLAVFSVKAAEVQTSVQAAIHEAAGASETLDLYTSQLESLAIGTPSASAQGNGDAELAKAEAAVDLTIISPEDFEIPSNSDQDEQPVVSKSAALVVGPERGNSPDNEDSKAADKEGRKGFGRSAPPSPSPAAGTSNQSAQKEDKAPSPSQPAAAPKETTTVFETIIQIQTVTSTTTSVNDIILMTTAYETLTETQWDTSTQTITVTAAGDQVTTATVTQTVTVTIPGPPVTVTSQVPVAVTVPGPTITVTEGSQQREQQVLVTKVVITDADMAMTTFTIESLPTANMEPWKQLQFKSQYDRAYRSEYKRAIKGQLKSRSNGRQCRLKKQSSSSSSSSGSSQ